MTVRELINILLEQPQDNEVNLNFEGIEEPIKAVVKQDEVTMIYAA